MKGKKGDNMNVKICGYDVSINAKHFYQDKKSKRATLELLNYLSLILDEAADNYERNCYEDNAKIVNRYSDELYKICRDNGLYKA